MLQNQSTFNIEHFAYLAGKAGIGHFLILVFYPAKRLWFST